MRHVENLNLKRLKKIILIILNIFTVFVDKRSLTVQATNIFKVGLIIIFNPLTPLPYRFYFYS